MACECLSAPFLRRKGSPGRVAGAEGLDGVENIHPIFISEALTGGAEIFAIGKQPEVVRLERADDKTGEVLNAEAGEDWRYGGARPGGGWMATGDDNMDGIAVV